VGDRSGSQIIARIARSGGSVQPEFLNLGHGVMGAMPEGGASRSGAGYWYFAAVMN
jgi:hypothetical protein